MKESVYRKPYQEEFRRQAVELLISSGKPCEQLARELGCSGYRLHLWKRYQHTGRGTEARYALIEALSVEFDVKACCEALSVSRSGFYPWQNPEPGKRARSRCGLAGAHRGSL